MQNDVADCGRPKVSLNRAANLAESLFGLHGRLKELVSDRDQNFHIDTGGEGFVFKISNSDEDPLFLDLQNRALLHLEETVPSLTLPKLVCSQQGEEMATTHVGDKAHLVRALTYVQGELFSRADKSQSLLRTLGTYMGRLSRGLQGFGHPAAHRPNFIWNLDNILACEVYVPDIVDDKNRSVVEGFFERYKCYVAPHVKQLRSAVIHNDINDNNIIVTSDRCEVAAVIDFGDMVYARQVNELATALAYALMGQEDLLAAARTIIMAYASEFPLLEREADLLFDLVAMRLVMSVCISSHRGKMEMDNEYLFISQEPAFELLHRLAVFRREELADCARTACGFPRAQQVDVDLQDMIAHRQKVLGPSLSLAYKNHLKIVRGNGAYLYDHTRRAYLDCVNNISHVGHCHPHVVQALSHQAGVLNTNTRYLHDTIQLYAERLTETMPDPLSVVFFVCSGSEANELALRMAKTKTEREGVIVLDWAYHGNTSGLVDISPYKFNRKGGKGRPDHVRIAEIPDPYRGSYKGYGAEAGRSYAKNISACVEDMNDTLGEGPAAFIAESIAGVGGQILYPDGYLDHAYEIVRAAGGLCIADEVQVGFGRVGSHMWAFEQQGVVPDIVTLGKPIGNGHPMAAVVTTPEVADAFANGMEYFNSFGGNPVSCAVGMAVLDVIEAEGLQNKAHETGAYLLDGLRALKDKYALIGDVRGTGLFLGIELVQDRETLEPAPVEAYQVVQYCREEAVLMSTDGPFENVIKIKPPMVFGIKEADLLLSTLSRAFAKL